MLHSQQDAHVVHTHRLVFSKKFAQLDLGASLGPLAKPGLDMVWDVFKQLVLILKGCNDW